MGNFAYVASVSNESYKCLFKIFHLFQTYVCKHFLSGCCICFTNILQECVPNVSSVVVLRCSKCFLWKLHMLQWLYTYVVNVCFKCFSFFKSMLQVFYLDVAYVAVAIHICDTRMFQMFHLFQTYVATSASCYKCFL
jgi:hypothetical protein